MRNILAHGILSAKIKGLWKVGLKVLCAFGANLGLAFLPSLQKCPGIVVYKAFVF